ncbi:MAG: hypothetical protein GYB65_03510, partial [Chloroflexi bacterium]|nr:hypothetical protein [Chloroflexota bacterium]
MTNQRKVLYVWLAAIVVVAVALGGAGNSTHAQDGPVPVAVDIVPYGDGPILPVGAEGEWDSGFTYGAQVVVVDGVYHMFYAGGQDFSIRPSAIGYATSPDGITWTKYDGNPILEITDPMVAMYGIRMVVPLVEPDGTWVLYVNPHERPDIADQSLSILRATALDPTGPWTFDEQPVMVAERGRTWDGHLVAANAVLRVDDEYVMYYDAYGAFGAVGLATSPDGVTWTRYDDPATADAPFDQSDPVFTGSLRGNWDDGDNIDPVAVRLGENGWEMFYTGWGVDWFSYFGGGATCDDVPAGTALAYSADGITW